MYRKKLLLFAATCLLMVAGLWCALLLEFEHDEQKTTTAAAVNLGNLALAFEQHVLGTVRHIDTLMLELRDEYLTGAGNLDRRVKFHLAHSQKDLFFQISVIDAHGILVYSSQDNPCQPIDLSDREHFRVHLNTSADHLFISKPLIGRVSKKWSLQFTRKILNKDGSFRGVLVLSMDPEYFSSFFRSIDVGKQGAITLVGLDRVIRAHAGLKGVEGKGFLIPENRPFFNRLNPAGLVKLKSSLDGVRRTIAYRRLRDYPLVVLVGFGSDDIRAAFIARKESLIFKGILVSTALVGAFCLIAWFERKQHLLNARVVASEEQFRQLSRSLEARVQEEIEKNSATQRLILQQEKLASIGQLAAGVAHEINNPMSFITSNLRMLDKYFENLITYSGRLKELLIINSKDCRPVIEAAERELDVPFLVRDCRDSIAESLDGAARVTKIVADLRGVSRSDVGEFAPADVNACLDSTLNIVNSHLKYVATVVKEYHDLPPVHCNAHQLTQVFMNLLVNAAQSITGKGVITIHTASTGAWVVVEISDTGAGINAADLPHIFEPFFTTKDVGQGTGLGLSIAYDIVQKHGGALEVESCCGKGTTFRMRIPCAPGDTVPGNGTAAVESC